jgi:hypothetical protein
MMNTTDTDFYAHLKYNPNSNSLVCKFPHEICLADTNQPESLYEMSIIEGSLHCDFHTSGDKDFVDVVIIRDQDNQGRRYRFYSQAQTCPGLEAYWKQIGIGLRKTANGLKRYTEFKITGEIITFTVKSADVYFAFSEKMQRHFKTSPSGNNCPATVRYTSAAVGTAGVEFALTFDVMAGYRRIYAISNLAKPQFFGDTTRNVLSSSLVEEPKKRVSSYIEIYDNMSRYFQVNARQLSLLEVSFIDEEGVPIVLNRKHGYCMVHLRKRLSQ